MVVNSANSYLAFLMLILFKSQTKKTPTPIAKTTNIKIKMGLILISPALQKYIY